MSEHEAMDDEATMGPRERAARAQRAQEAMEGGGDAERGAEAGTGRDDGPQTARPNHYMEDGMGRFARKSKNPTPHFLSGMPRSFSCVVA